MGGGGGGGGGWTGVCVLGDGGGVGRLNLSGLLLLLGEGLCREDRNSRSAEAQDNSSLAQPVSESGLLRDGSAKAESQPTTVFFVILASG